MPRALPFTEETQATWFPSPWSETDLNRKWQLFGLNHSTYLSRSFSTSRLLFSTPDRVFHSIHFHLKTNHLIGCAPSCDQKFFHCSAHHEILYQYLKNQLFSQLYSSFNTYLTIVKVTFYSIRLERTYIIFLICQTGKVFF